MKKVVLIFAVNVIAVSWAQFGTTDETEMEVIQDMMDMIAEDTCDEHAQSIGQYCCASEEILGVFERMMGLKSVRLCQIYVTMCINQNCGLKCTTLSCPEHTEEETRIEKLIKSKLYSDQQILQILLPELLSGIVEQDESEKGQAQSGNGVKHKRQIIRKMASLFQQEF